MYANSAITSLTSSGLSQTVQNLDSNSCYRYTVTARNANSSSSPSNFIHVRTALIVQPPPPLPPPPPAVSEIDTYVSFYNGSFNFTSAIPANGYELIHQTQQSIFYSYVRMLKETNTFSSCLIQFDGTLQCGVLEIRPDGKVYQNGQVRNDAYVQQGPAGNPYKIVRFANDARQFPVGIYKVGVFPGTVAPPVGSIRNVTIRIYIGAIL